MNAAIGAILLMALSATLSARKAFGWQAFRLDRRGWKAATTENQPT
jgi:hypothetical protein